MSDSSAHFLVFAFFLVPGGPPLRLRIRASTHCEMSDAVKGRDSGWIQRILCLYGARQWLAHGVSLVLASCLPFASIAMVAADSLWQKATKEGKPLREEGPYEEAEKAILRGLAEAENLGPEHCRVALTLNELAVLHHSRGRLSEAEALYRRALAIWEALPARIELATLLGNLARLCLDQERYPEVEVLSKRALEISQTCAPNHPEVANALINLADVHAIQDRYAEAEPSTVKP